MILNASLFYYRNQFQSTDPTRTPEIDVKSKVITCMGIDIQFQYIYIDKIGETPWKKKKYSHKFVVAVNFIQHGHTPNRLILLEVFHL